MVTDAGFLCYPASCEEDMEAFSSADAEPFQFSAEGGERGRKLVAERRSCLASVCVANRDHTLPSMSRNATQLKSSPNCT